MRLAIRCVTPRHGPAVLRAVQITRFGGPEVLDIVDVPYSLS
jgi:hypothetical protein